MKKIFLLIIAMAICVNSLDKMSVPHTFSTGDTLTYSKYNDNNDTPATYMNKIVDTVNLNVPRYTQNTYTHDLIMPYLRVDSIRSNVDIDSISGNPLIDSIETTVIRGNPDVDSLSGSIHLDSIEGNPYSDSINTDLIAATQCDIDSGSIDTLKSVEIIVDTVRADDLIRPNDTTFSAYCSLYDDATYRTRELFNFMVHGDFITISTENILGTCSGGDVYIRCANDIKACYKGIYQPELAFTVINNSVHEIGRILPYDGYFMIVDGASDNLASGNGGLCTSQITYRWQ